MFNWIVSNKKQYLESYNFTDLSYTELFEIELLLYLSVS